MLSKNGWGFTHLWAITKLSQKNFCSLHQQKKKKKIIIDVIIFRETDRILTVIIIKYLIHLFNLEYTINVRKAFYVLLLCERIDNFILPNSNVLTHRKQKSTSSFPQMNTYQYKMLLSRKFQIKLIFFWVSILKSLVINNNSEYPF